jgi:hypothetical protein
MKLIIQNENVRKEVPCEDWFEATSMRDACRETLQIALRGAVSEIFEKKGNAFIVKGNGVYVELIIKQED